MFRGFSHGEICATLYWKVYTRKRLDDAFVEIQVFEKKVIKQVLNDTNYIRSLRTILILVDSRNHLKWDTFWKNNEKEKNKETLPLLETFYYEVTKT